MKLETEYLWIIEIDGDDAGTLRGHCIPEVHETRMMVGGKEMRIIECHIWVDGDLKGKVTYY